ncbi:hypothetical protein LI90_631 [Carbonactinospora thermoautotrophica]|uniref:DUF397 domain-containing protein n=1 Tax=Carbonactinospora thermoautotrophica TaxID=1469144 RepID=A0A132MMB5_9ACTN|nr:DUF397 domain-containing protein [Carbonactinospora thermoautotrophica]KWW99000.1 hypothetical protein LI90_631 [Carbonactinospora thermoautotrophica]
MTDEQRKPGFDRGDLARAAWRKSSFSGAQSDCVEVAPVAGVIAVRDSKNPHGPKLVFTHDEWTAFTSGVKAGEFDDLLA